ncbi:hypothetical protein ACFE04_030011 [Oxalis oulophora]
MGLRCELHDISSNSLPILLIILIATTITSLRSSILSFLYSLHLISYSTAHGGDYYDDFSLLISSDQRQRRLDINRNSKTTKYKHTINNDDDDCVVCMCRLRDGDLVRRLDCRHVFHKHCLDGWLDSMKLTCPLCRAPVLIDRQVDVESTRVRGGILAWFSFSS